MAGIASAQFNPGSGGGEGTVKSVNNILPDSLGNVHVDIPPDLTEKLAETNSTLAQVTENVQVNTLNILSNTNKLENHEIRITDLEADSYFSLGSRYFEPDNTNLVPVEGSMGYASAEIVNGVLCVNSIGGSQLTVENVATNLSIGISAIFPDFEYTISTSFVGIGRFKESSLSSAPYQFMQIRASVVGTELRVRTTFELSRKYEVGETIVLNTPTVTTLTIPVRRMQL